MNLQTIKSLDGKVEYVLLPVAAYHALRVVIQKQLEYHQKRHMNHLSLRITLIIQWHLHALMQALPKKH